MKVIDLHGIKHEDVDNIIIDACSKYETPFIIITGNSNKMKLIVETIVNKFELRIRDSLRNSGRVVVDEV